jgi:hypothetical protein
MTFKRKGCLLAFPDGWIMNILAADYFNKTLKK